MKGRMSLLAVVLLVSLPLIAGGLPPSPPKQVWLTPVMGNPSYNVNPVTSSIPVSASAQIVLCWNETGEYTKSLTALSLNDGAVLWSSSGVAYSFPSIGVRVMALYRAASFLQDKIVADFFFNDIVNLKYLIQIQGFAIIDPQTGKVLVQQVTDLTKDSWTTSLSATNSIYYTSNGKLNGTLFRLVAPNYDPAHPLLTYSWQLAAPLPAVESWSGLTVGQQKGILLHTINSEGVLNMNNITLQRLDPHNLTPIWAQPNMFINWRPSLVEPTEDEIVLTFQTPNSPFKVAMMGYDGLGQQPSSPTWQWKTVIDTTGYISFGFDDMAVNSQGRRLACGRLLVSAAKLISFVCIDPKTETLAVNMTIRANGTDEYTFLTICRQWVLLLNLSTWDVEAWNLFEPFSGPEWIINGQKNLFSLTVGGDGTYLLAVYANPTAVALWSL